MQVNVILYNELKVYKSEYKFKKFFKSSDAQVSESVLLLKVPEHRQRRR